MKYRPGDTAFIVSNNRFINEVEILNISYGFVTLRFLDHKGGIKLRITRLFPTKEDAEASIKKKREENSQQATKQ